MRKVCFSLLALVLLIAGAIWAYENYHDVLAAGMFILALIPSAMFNEGRKELKGE